jgi:single-stranded-DNA-specific exonuclease
MHIGQVKMNRQSKDREVFIPELVSRFLKSRGYLNKEDQVQFLNPLLKNIKDPFKLLNMQIGIDRLVKALASKEKIGLYCDYDLDGSSSAAILKKGLSGLGLNVEALYQPRRLTEGYGFHKSGVDKFKEQGISLIVTADVGITSVETVEYASDIGIDVIVTDHHLPDDKLPQALAVINPNQKDCMAGLGHLCGAGVAFYLVYALAKTLKKISPLPRDFDLEELLDYLVIGTITDMVPLVKENRTLVKRGLSQFTKTLKPGLKAIKVKEGLIGKSISSSDIGFKIAPKLNSLSRLDTDLRPTDILVEKSRERATQLVDQAYLVNEKRKETLEAGLELALNGCYKNDFCFYVSSQIHPGVMGLIATQMVKSFNLPAFVGSELENGQVVGSARLPRHSGLSLKEVLKDCSSLLQYGGHAQAAGFELNLDKVEEFKKEIHCFIKSHQITKEESLFIDQEFDCEVMLSELNRSFIPWLNQLEPFGTGFEAPRFKVSRVKVKSLTLLKDVHYKLTISDTDDFIAEALWFFPPEEHEVLELLEGDAFKNRFFNFYVTPQINFFRNSESLQLLVNEVEVF